MTVTFPNKKFNLTPKHRLFVEAYNGDTLEAMQLSGYRGDPHSLRERGEQLLQTPLIIEAIRARSKYLTKTQNIIADREERQSFWSSLMRNQDPNRIAEFDEHNVPIPFKEIPLAQRIKASELLGKSETDFVEKIDLTGTLTVTDIITQAYQINDGDIDAIEAEYELIHNPPALEEEENSAPIEPASEITEEITEENSIEDFM